jgi:phage tail sheath gpL-like
VANRIDELLDGYYGSADKLGDKPTAAELESALYNGVTPVTYNAQDAEQVKRPIVTHSKTSTGADDGRLLDTQNVDATYIYARDLRDNLPLAFPNAKLSEDLVAGEDPLPKGVTEERDIKAWLVDRSRFWVGEGVIDGPTLTEVVADGSFIVQVNSSDATQVDIVIPLKVIQPLAKFGLVVQRRPS